MRILSSRGSRSRSAARLTSVVLSECASDSDDSVLETSGSGVGSDSASGSGAFRSGILIGSSGASGSAAGAGISTLGAGNGPTDSASSPVSPSGTDDGAATGSEKTGSALVVFVILSIAFCKSLSTLA